MPFEPLQTDEKLEGPPRKPQSTFEKQMMSGCFVILVTCFLVYFVVMWPWFVFPAYTVPGLINCLVFGAAAAAVLGIVATLKFQLAGGAGFLGGGLAAAVFMYLRMDQFMLGRGHNDLPQPEYPERWVILVPLAWVLLSAAVVAIFLPKETDDHPAAPENNQD